MDEFKTFRRIFIWFVVHDHNHLVSTFGGISRSLRIFYICLKIVFITLYMTSIIQPLQAIFRSSSVSVRIAGIFNDIAIVILIVNLTEIIESWVYSEALGIVIKAIKESIHYLNSFINMKNHISAFACRFRKKLFLFLMLYFIELSVKMTSRSKFATSYSKILLAIAALYRNLALLQVISLIDVQILILSSLNHHLNPVFDNSVNNCLILQTPSSKVFVALRHIKTIYSNIQTISENINKRFGCSLVIAVINVSFFAIRTGVSFYLTLISSNSIIEISRK